MNGYMISIVGAIVIAIYSLIVFLVFRGIDRLAMRFFPNGLARGCQLLLLLLALALLSLPWLEEAWIVWHFNQACQDAGVKVYRQVEVTGYATDRSDYHGSIDQGLLFSQDPTRVADFEKEGFRYYEDLLPDGRARHLEREERGVTVTIRDKPEAKYLYKYHYVSDKTDHDEPIGWKLTKIELQVIDRQTGEILGRDTTIKRVLPTHEALILGMFGPPIVMCPSYKFLQSHPQPSFPKAVLKPIAKPQP